MKKPSEDNIPAPDFVKEEDMRYADALLEDSEFLRGLVDFVFLGRDGGGTFPPS